MRSELNAISGQGKGNVLVSLTAKDKPTLVAEVVVNVHDMPPNSTFSVERRLGLPPLDGNCTSTPWQPLGSITTSEGGAGAEHFDVDRREPFVSGFQFDIQFHVIGNGTELQSDCFRLTVK